MALPPTSPRLPSPPPAAEIQIGPKSPAMSGATLAQQQMEQQMEQTILDANSKRRIHPGTRASDFAAGPPLVPLSELDSAFQLQEHLSALHYHHTASNTQAITRDTALILAKAPVGTDRTLWLYELCRFLIAQCNSLIIGFLFDTPPCSAATCPEMRASEWQFLCAVHEQPRSCCAIDYCCHTLDWAANVVTNPKIFPSRFAFADQHDKNAAMKNLVNVFRRLHRIFAHAWFQHRGVFWSVEGQTGLYVFFKTVCDMYDLLPAENYKLPPEAEGLDASGSFTGSGAPDIGSKTGASAESTPGLIPMAAITERKGMGFTAGVLNHRPGSGTSGGGGSGGGLGTELLTGENSIGRTNTRRHIRSSPSTGSAVTTVLEQDEDSNSSSSPFAPSRPLTILQHADRMSTPVSRGAAVVPPPAPTPPASQEASDASEPKASITEVEEKEADEAEAVEKPAIVIEAATEETPKEDVPEAPAAEEDVKAEVATGSMAEEMTKAEDTPATTKEEPVSETADKDDEAEAEAAEPSSDESAEATSAETGEETEKTEEAAAEAEAEASAETGTSDDAATEDKSTSDDNPAAPDDKEEAGKLSTTVEAEPAED